MRVIVIEVFDDEQADDAFSVIMQSLDIADINCRVSLTGDYEEPDADGGVS